SSGKETILKVMVKVSNFLRIFGIDLRYKLFKSVHDAFGGNLRKIVCGGAPLRQELGEFFNSIGISLTNGYGITECSPLVSVNHDTFNDCSTVGKPLPCCEIKIDLPDEDGIGEICVRGDVVMLGYYKQPELTMEVLSEDGWFKTGDFGFVNKDGQLVITGRKKNIILLDNGKNIFPEEIENYIMSIPYVEEVVVYGIKNKDGVDEKLSCQVFLSEEKIEELSIENPREQIKTDIFETLKELPVYKRVSNVIVRDEAFEKTTTKKIKRAVIDTTK
ncbi:MAG: AMP-binding protein, partial [Clostridia bacterium]|nr:AMP-binding protein [Clostridia bacterium]